MTRKERIVLQRQRAREAIGILRGVGELFGAEEKTDSQYDKGELEYWESIVDKVESEIFDEGPIA